MSSFITRAIDRTFLPIDQASPFCSIVGCPIAVQLLFSNLLNCWMSCFTNLLNCWMSCFMPSIIPIYSIVGCPLSSRSIDRTFLPIDQASPFCSIVGCPIAVFQSTQLLDVLFHANLLNCWMSCFMLDVLSHAAAEADSIRGYSVGPSHLTSFRSRTTME